MPLRRLSALLLVLVAVPVVASCRASFRPLHVAESCRCSPQQYCRVRPASSPGASGASAGTTSVECLPLPAACGSQPSCACVGRPVDACREELGALTVLEPRAVKTCDECGGEEYCWRPSPGGAERVCRVIPARCEETPSCACFLEAHRGGAALDCDDRDGRIQAGPVASRP